MQTELNPIRLQPQRNTIRKYAIAEHVSSVNDVQRRNLPKGQRLHVLAALEFAGVAKMKTIQGLTY